ncbi:Oidioi.mRNA.OKI2018_I69.PAR.g10032.t2.cds [Oikopleura dioica]|uniref:Oidioi.mRNA.OKI2018_I69.PAR.g10032.t2.cds n=1 Tax=Oikopleura dioica TaxID=34765 RepID=A0ABN7RPL3_OIKDI|nr:Oidioi.mRNA.OKI2018_I69.PAR.g10032.t2.cds [Oikopleura dioica]
MMIEMNSNNDLGLIAEEASIPEIDESKENSLFSEPLTYHRPLVHFRPISLPEKTRRLSRRFSRAFIGKARRHTMTELVEDRNSRRSSLKFGREETQTSTAHPASFLGRQRSDSVTSGTTAADGRRGSLLFGNRRNSSVRALADSKFRSAVKNTIMNRLTNDGRTFSGLPMTFYNPEYQERELFENTYKLNPDRKFNVANVKPLIAATVAKFAENSSYSHYHAQSRVGMMCDRVREELKQFGYARYRYIISGFIGEQGRHGLHIASRSLINDTFDRSFEISINTPKCITICTVHAIFTE